MPGSGLILLTFFLVEMATCTLYNVRSEIVGGSPGYLVTGYPDLNPDLILSVGSVVVFNPETSSTCTVVLTTNTTDLFMNNQSAYTTGVVAFQPLTWLYVSRLFISLT